MTEIVEQQHSVSELDKEEFVSVVKEFYTSNETKKSSEKKAKDLNGRIKEMLKGADLMEFEGEGFAVKLRVDDKSTMNDQKLIQLLKELGHNDAIQTVEVIDSAKVETLIYEGHIDPALLAPCQEPKFVEVLTVKQVKPKAEKK